MADAPAIPPGTPRVFGRIDRFTCECPRCGQLIQAQFDRPAGKIRRQQIQTKVFHKYAKRVPKPHATLTYNPLTSRLTCPQCSRVFGVGLLLYPVHPRSAPSQPLDQRPTFQQLLAMRQLAGGFFMDKHRPIRGSDSLNIVSDEDCACWLENSTPPRMHYVARCPIHGWLDQPGAEEVVDVTGELPPATDPHPNHCLCAACVCSCHGLRLEDCPVRRQNRENDNRYR